MAIGITETVPGVSGSTIAMILGIYEKLIYSLSILTSHERKEAMPFLITFGLGMVIGFALSINIINYLLHTYRTPTLMFFVGIIVAFIPFLWKEANNHAKTNLTMKHYLIITLFVCLVVLGQLLGGSNTLEMSNLSLGNYLFLVSAGFIASTALVLPGISGALMLTILGIYEIATAAVISLYIS